MKWYGYLIYCAIGMVIPFTYKQWQFYAWDIALTILVIIHDLA